jgi:hypothetical protein
MTVRHFLAASALALLAAAAPAQAPHVPALSTVESGEWQFKEPGGAVHQLCLASPEALIQMQHHDLNCARTVVTQDRRSVTFRYTCPGAGYGRTSITVETGRLFKLETQGIAGGAPFDLQYEARRIGNCG